MTSDPFLVGFVVFLLAGLGLSVGSFLNVVIYRVPRDLSIVRPGSACPACGTEISPRDNIPLLSWLLLRGRCRACHEPISARYPAVELLNALLWLLLAWWAWDADAMWLLPLLLALGSAGIALWFIDLEHHRLPNAIVLPLYPVTVAGLALAGVMSGSWEVASALVGGGAWVLVIGGLWLVTGGRGMGLGDVKLAPVLGATLGWIGIGSALVGLFAAFMIGAVVGVGLMVARRAGRRSALPFGPFLLAGAAVGLVAGQSLASSYTGMIGG